LPPLTSNPLGPQVDIKGIDTQTTSYEYYVLVDVISSIILAPLPEIDVLKRHVSTSPADSEPALAPLLVSLAPALQKMRAKQHLLASLSTCVPFPLMASSLILISANSPLPSIARSLRCTKGMVFRLVPGSGCDATKTGSQRESFSSPSSSPQLFPDGAERSPSPDKARHSLASSRTLPRSALHRQLQPGPTQVGFCQAQRVHEPPLDVSLCPLRASIVTMTENDSRSPKCVKSPKHSHIDASHASRQLTVHHRSLSNISHVSSSIKSGPASPEGKLIDEGLTTTERGLLRPGIAASPAKSGRLGSTSLISPCVLDARPRAELEAELSQSIQAQTMVQRSHSACHRKDGSCELGNSISDAGTHDSRPLHTHNLQAFFSWSRRNRSI
jgi:hypothetical protein